MNKFAEITVVQFKKGITAESFTRDEDFRTGRKTDELAGKTRIQWESDDSYEWVNSNLLVKLDNRHFQYMVDLPVETTETTETK